MTSRRRRLPTRRFLLSPLGAATGLGVLQLALLVAEEQRVYTRGELSIDYQVFGRAFWAIGHGNLSPVAFIPGAGAVKPYLANHFELLTWPLALLFVGALRLPVHVVLLLLLQALPTAALTPLVALWARMVSRRSGLRGWRDWVVVLGPALLSFLDVWNYRAASFDFHYQALEAALLAGVLIAWEAGRRWTGWVLLGVLAMTGDPSGLVVAVVAGHCLLHRRWRRGIAVSGLAAAAVLVPSVLHDNLGTAAALPGYATAVGAHSQSLGAIALAGLTHPTRALRHLLERSPQIWGLLGGAGLIGIFSDVGLLAAIFIGIPSWIGANVFAYPGLFQTVPVTCALLLGSTGVLSRLMRWRPAGGGIIAAGSVALALGWTAVFTPGLVDSVANVSTVAAGSSLKRIAAQVPTDSEVFSPNASIGVVGERSATAVPEECPPFSLPLGHRLVEVVADPWRGIQTCGSAELLSSLSALAAAPGATLAVPQPGGVIVCRIPPGAPRNESIPAVYPIGARLLAATPFAHGRLVGDGKQSVIASRPQGGMLLEGITADLPPLSNGAVDVLIRVRGTAQIQVWDDTTKTLIAQRTLHGTDGFVASRFSFPTPSFVPPAGFTDGVEPFRTRLLPPIRVDPMELRVWVPTGTGSSAEVRSVEIGPASAVLAAPTD